MVEVCRDRLQRSTHVSATAVRAPAPPTASSSTSDSEPTRPRRSPSRRREDRRWSRNSRRTRLHVQARAHAATDREGSHVKQSSSHQTQNSARCQRQPQTPVSMFAIRRHPSPTKIEKLHERNTRDEPNSTSNQTPTNPMQRPDRQDKHDRTHRQRGRQNQALLQVDCDRRSS